LISLAPIDLAGANSRYPFVRYDAAKALSGSIVADEGDTGIGDGEVGKEDYGKIGRYAGF
jgi:hypothetical protein